MKIPRLYLDTSVIGGYFDPEFEKSTMKLFAQLDAGRGVAIVSDVTLDELAEAPDRVRELVGPKCRFSIETVDESAESVELAKAYVAAGVVPEGYFNDARHVALATVADASLLVSWNFKHIVRFDKIRSFNAINMLRGYLMLDIRSPMEVPLDEY